MQEVWRRLKPQLRRLADRADTFLQQYPDPEVDTDRTPPFSIGLWPWAVEVAADLHHRFGPDVELTVGAMTYPEGTVEHPDGVQSWWPEVPTATATEIVVTVDTPLIVASGHEVAAGLTVHNRSTDPIRLWTNGTLVGLVVDPGTGDLVGGVIRQPMMAVTFDIGPQDSATIPFRVTTDSRVPGFGYAVPSGVWATQVILLLDHHRQLKTPPLPLLITG